MTACSFTLDEYGGYLASAISEGYRFVGFDSIDAAGDPAEPVILLRHDVDYDPAFMQPMAEIEAGLGVRSTYCLQVDSPWYSVDEPGNRGAIAATLNAGHWIGLHFDASSMESDAQVTEGIVEQAQRLGSEFSRDVRVVSFHMPGRRRVDHLALPDGLINTYSSRFFVEIGYVSDSNQNWRGVDLGEVLRIRAHRRLQLLIHPFWWRPRPATMRSKLQALADRLGIDVREIATPEQWQLIDEREAAQ